MQTRRFIYLAWTICVALPLAVLGIYLAQGKAAPSELVSAMSITVFSLAAVPFFILGLKQFKRGLRRAFGLISAGVVLYGLAQLQFPLATIFNMSFWVNSGGIVLPYIVSVTLLLIGIARFGKLLQLRSRWFQLRWAYPAAIIVAVLSAAIPHASIPLAETEFDVSVGLNNWVCVVVLFAAVSVWRIRAAAADRYRTTLNWLFASLVLLALSALHYAVISYTAFTSWYAASPFMYSFMLPSTMCFLQAAYAFTRVNRLEAIQAGSSTPVDVIMYVAGMASKPAAIDPQLDTLRRITSTAPGKSQLSAALETELAELYKQLEKYLVHNEPLRAISASELREAVRNRFQSSNTHSNSPFWKLFETV